jgi:hypothetical protein
MDVEPSVTYVIDELVLDGVEAGDPNVREALAQAFGDGPRSEAATAAAADAVSTEIG